MSQIENQRDVFLSDVTDIPIFPYADLLPILDEGVATDGTATRGTTLSKIADSVIKNGQYDPIVVWFDDDGIQWLLDGRNRRLACEMAAKVLGQDPTEFQVSIETFVGDYDKAKAFVKSKGLERRDMTTFDRANTAVSWWELEAMDAQDRKSLGAAITNAKRWGTEESLPTNLSDATGTWGDTRDILSKEWQVGPTYIQDVLNMRKKATTSSEAAERATAEAEKYAEAEREAKAKLEALEELNSGDPIVKETFIANYGPITGTVEEEIRTTATKANNAALHKVEERERAAEQSAEAAKVNNTLEKLGKRQTNLSQVRKETKNSGKDESEVAITKAAQEFNNGYKKVIDNGVFLLKEGRPNDQENVRLKYSHICEKFNSLEEVELQTQHYFTPDHEPSDDESRWGGEVRIRLGGVYRMVLEHNVKPESVSRCGEFIEILTVLRDFFDEIEAGLEPLDY